MSTCPPSLPDTAHLPLGLMPTQLTEAAVSPMQPAAEAEAEEEAEEEEEPATLRALRSLRLWEEGACLCMPSREQGSRAPCCRACPAEPAASAAGAGSGGTSQRRTQPAASPVTSRGRQPEEALKGMALLPLPPAAAPAAAAGSLKAEAEGRAAEQVRGLLSRV